MAYLASIDPLYLEAGRQLLRCGGAGAPQDWDRLFARELNLLWDALEVADTAIREAVLGMENPVSEEMRRFWSRFTGARDALADAMLYALVPVERVRDKARELSPWLAGAADS
jgi:hypothetical protein